MRGSGLVLHWLSVAALSLLTLFSNGAWAHSYAPSSNEDVVHIADPQADLLTKLHMINGARRMILLTAFAVGRDEYGIAMVEALRAALRRGVPVKVIFNGFITRFLGNDVFLLLENELAAKDMPLRAELVDMSLIDKATQNLELMDFIHEKLLIVDPQTSSSAVYFGGRDPYLFASKTLDSGFLVRPLDPTKYYLGDALHDQFMRTWQALFPSYAAGTFGTLLEGVAENQVRGQPLGLLSPNVSLNSYSQILPLLMRRPVRGERLESFQFRPQSTQLLTNDLLFRIASGQVTAEEVEQSENIAKDDIVKPITELISEAKNIEIYGYSADYEVNVLSALLTALDHGTKVRIYTNGKSTVENMDVLSGFLGRLIKLTYLAYLNGMSAMWEIKSLTRNPTNLRVFVTNLKKLGNLNYLHRKLILIDDQIVMSGSHNYTASSASKNDEVMVLFRDAKMNTYFRDLNQIEEKSFYDEIDPMDPAVDEEAHGHQIRKFLFNPLTRSIS